MSNIINLTKMSFFNLKSIFKQIWFFLTMWIIISAFNSTFLNMLCGIVIFLTIYQVIAYEDVYGIDTLVCVLPVKKKEYVLSRYLMGIISLAISIIIVSAEYFIAVNINQNFISLDILLVIGISMGVISISIVIPILLKFGANKGKIFIILMMIIPSGLTNYLVQSPEAIQRIIQMKNIGEVGLIAFVLNFVVLAISTTISIKIYENKEIK